ncbi:KinB signaling pathway activation protein [Cohnella sp. OV330]|uniref:KinB-signaling pathway activation protein n=1 Tax=Cohnella sp. OV330 TaxID=1855288 RepID=UPI0008EA8CA1|nr:KinB-signaling pathway activation protein [Cohnella sp. OV330]SFB61131.1 KinB signaling pathway activation protein [Cohnella sp. OV330]
MNLRKWMTLFGTTILIGGGAALITGVVMMVCDPDFQIGGARGWAFNLIMMALAGLSFGAFAHMGFFAYLMLNYIARSIIKRPYLWVALQGFVALFVLAEIVYWTHDSEFPPHAFWIVPLLLSAGALAVAWRKAKETTAGAWIPTLFFMIAVTTIEGLPGFRSGGLWTQLTFTLVPIFVCNAYQILRLHHILTVPGTAQKVKTEAGSH